MKRLLYIVGGLVCLSVSAYFFYLGLYGGTSSDFYRYIIERPDYLLTLGQAQMRVGIPIVSLIFGTVYFIFGLNYRLVNKWSDRSMLILFITAIAFFVLLLISMSGACFGCEVPSYVSTTYSAAYYVLVIGILLSLYFVVVSLVKIRRQ